MNSVLDRFLRTININSFDSQLEFKIMQYEDFWGFKEIGSGSHGTVYTARCKHLYKSSSNCAVLKSLNNFNQIIGSFISEVSNSTRLALMVEAEFKYFIILYVGQKSCQMLIVRD